MNRLALIICTSLLSACSYNAAPVVGSHDKTGLEYEQDLAECRQKTQEVDKGEAVRTSAANMALIGTAAGALGGILSDDVGMGESMVWGLALGAGTGAAVGSVKATQTQSLVLRRCMELKGYEILDAEVDDLAKVDFSSDVDSKDQTVTGSLHKSINKPNDKPVNKKVDLQQYAAN
ncbi:glycine zipper family protein [Photobacterium sp. DNB23_23_1]|uniref:Glycine zipper family protein n=1 Tax=Photobacterium pectinilyticum TaxID=2906793 RepID=A0ABT1MYT2_9GAMM|nr:glycine zipper family protein [Photobacterium sp. ZSDE20]MCQ1057630.1 glycine zipper family protein [Photobacterium sp. ZSDE20]MDD1821965.1 glycine zipper family protein [Photobacterium sp. ZSDE20]